MSRTFKIKSESSLCVRQAKDLLCKRKKQEVVNKLVRRRLGLLFVNILEVRAPACKYYRVFHLTINKGTQANIILVYHILQRVHCNIGINMQCPK